MRARITSERIRRLLDELYETGKISITDYEWGIAGLPLVHDMVKSGQKAESADDDIPF